MSLLQRRVREALAEVADPRGSGAKRARKRSLRWAAFFGAGLGAGMSAALMAPVRVPRGGE